MRTAVLERPIDRALDLDVLYRAWHGDSPGDQSVAAGPKDARQHVTYLVVRLEHE